MTTIVGFSWCRYCEVVWSEDAKRIPIEEFIDRYTSAAPLPVADCHEPHGYAAGSKVPVAFCKICVNQLVLVQNPDGSFSLPPHDSEGEGCAGSNVQTEVLMMRDPSDMT